MADFTVKGDTSLDTSGAEKGFNKVGAVGKVAKAGIVAIVAATVAIGTAAITAYADWEQLVGGVDTLFKESSGKVQEYADNAYKTSGLSANDYMRNVTSFSASLLQSLGGDTEKAADYADMAMVDMADNANKMGTNVAEIQNAYQGFAKQNYTMLDNLKLGYGGTKTEMERLLKDASAISGIEYDISSYADVVSALHVMQDEMGITGTTAEEAEHTISGSIGSLKASFGNLIAGMGNADADIGLLVSNVAESFKNVITNLTPVIENVLASLPIVINGLISAVVEMLPMILEVGVGIIVSLVQGIAQSLPTLVPAMINCVLLLIDTLVEALPLLIDAGIEIVIALALGLLEALPLIVAKIPVMIDSIITALVNAIPQLIEAGIILFVAIVQNLPAIIKGIVKAIPQIIRGIVRGFGTLKDSMAGVGGNIVSGIWAGISGGWDWLLGKVQGFADSIVNKVKDFLGIKSPSKKFMWLGEMSAEGMALGFEKDNPIDQINASLKSGMANIKASAAIRQEVMLNGIGNLPVNYRQEININQPVSQSPSEIARAIRRSTDKQGLAGAF